MHYPISMVIGTAGEGTGLGLSLSYDIVTKGYGGTIVVNKIEDPPGGTLEGDFGGGPGIGICYSFAGQSAPH